MSQDLVTQQSQMPAQVFGGRQLGASANHGAIAIEQERAIAEAQGQLTLAKRFPRDLTAAHAEMMTACKSKAFAETAFYAVKNRGSGPSIRFAEEIARTVGNFQYGHRELSRSAGKSEIEVFAWDMEKNNRSIRQITVNHILDTKDGPRDLRDQTDIDNKIANIAAKQMRGRILALMPKWLVAEAIDECKKTLAGTNNEPLEVRVRRMTQAFAKYGVSTDHLERYLGHKLDEMLIDELIDLTGVYNAIKDGEKPSEFFGNAEAAEAKDKTADAILQLGTDNAAKQPAAAKKAPAATKKAAETAKPAETAAPESAANSQPDTAIQADSNSDEKSSNPVKEAAQPVSEESVQEKTPDSAAAQGQPTSDDVF
jgi:hypothetical protein